MSDHLVIVLVMTGLGFAALSLTTSVATTQFPRTPLFLVFITLLSASLSFGFMLAGFLGFELSK